MRPKMQFTLKSTFLKETVKNKESLKFPKILEMFLSCFVVRLKTKKTKQKSANGALAPSACGFFPSENEKWLGKT